MPGLGATIDRQPTEPEREALGRLEAGQGWDEVARSLDLSPSDLIATVARAGLGPDGPPLIQASTSHPELVRATTEPALAKLLPEASRPSRLALAAGLLQILDDWDGSHHAAQEADDLGERATSAFWHMIAHRREPDPSNARYWARRIDHRHPALKPMIAAAQSLIGPLGDAFTPVWSPSTSIDLCTKARPGSSEATLARRLQRIEMIALLEQSLVALGLDPEG